MKVTICRSRMVVASLTGILFCISAVAANSQKGKGGGGGCVAPPPINPVVNACTNSTAQSGCIDSTFGNGGEALLLDTTLETQGTIRLQPQADGTQKIITGNGGSAMLARFNLDGTLDSTFGSAGVIGYPQADGGVSDLAIDANRNILVTGSAGTGSLFVIRFLPDGAIDTSFASNGMFTYKSSSSGWFANGWSLALQSDGKVVVAGSQSGPKPPTYSLVLRLTSNGALDPSFGSGGITSFIPAGSSNGGLKTEALQPIGSANYIVVSGNGWLGRLTPSGAVDSSFGSGGQAAGPTCGGVGNARSIYVDASGNIYLLGYSNLGITNGVWYITLTKYTVAGKLDTTFGDVTQSGHAGDTALNVFGGGPNVPGFNSSLTATTDSSGVTKLLVAGYGTGTPGTASVVARYNLNGTLDPTFGGGVVAREFGSGAAWGEGVVVEPNGEIVPFIVWDNSGGYLALTRYWP